VPVKRPCTEEDDSVTTIFLFGHWLWEQKKTRMGVCLKTPKNTGYLVQGRFAVILEELVELHDRRLAEVFYEQVQISVETDNGEVFPPISKSYH